MGSENPIVVEILIEELSDENPYTRVEAIESLGLMGTAAAPAIPQLTRLSNDKHEKVRSAAARTLSKIP
jgi:HEAT repeat protein